ncbi:MAG: SH3 domain-containing protein [Pseudomonadota bacterium]
MSRRRRSRGWGIRRTAMAVVLGLIALGTAVGSESGSRTSSERGRAVSSSASPTMTYVVTASSLRLRAAPAPNAAILAGATRGTIVVATGRREDGWIAVRQVDGTEGWMHGDYLEVAASGKADSEYLSRPDQRPVAREAIAPARLVTGQATIVDGDTIRVRGRQIRLEGIDAPEHGQRCEDAHGRSYLCGDRATTALRDLVGGRTVVCRDDGEDAYDRMLGTCWAAQDVGRAGHAPSSGGHGSLNATMVARGWALAFRRYSQLYVPEERAAQRAKRGMWQGRFVKPWDYRNGVRSSGRPTAATASAASPPRRNACAIKGNISGSGRIYHVPGSRWYARTRIDTRRGERWFCSESEARAAGWRAPRR